MGSSNVWSVPWHAGTAGETLAKWVLHHNVTFDLLISPLVGCFYLSAASPPLRPPQPQSVGAADRSSDKVAQRFPSANNKGSNCL